MREPNGVGESPLKNHRKIESGMYHDDIVAENTALMNTDNNFGYGPNKYMFY